VDVRIHAVSAPLIIPLLKFIIFLIVNWFRAATISLSWFLVGIFPFIAHASANATKTGVAVSDPGGIIAGAYFLFKPLRSTGRDNIVPLSKRKGRRRN
jgi:hypothetical protein